MGMVIEQTRAGEFLLSESMGYRSRETTVIVGGKFTAGHIMAKVVEGSAVGAALAGNTGDGAMSAIVVSGEAEPGEYVLLISQSLADGGKYTVNGPKMKNSTGAIGSEFSKKGLTFTLADGVTDFVEGDQFIITVVASSEKYTGFDPALHDTADGVLYGPTSAETSDVSGVVIVRDAEIISQLLSFKDGMTDAEKAAALSDLKDQGLLAR